MSGGTQRGANAAETKLLANIERYERAKADADAAMAQLKPMIAEARTATKELRQAQMQAHAAVELITECAQAEVSDVLKTECDKAIAVLGDETRATIADAQDKIIGEFDKLSALIFQGRNRVTGEQYDLRDVITEWSTRSLGRKPNPNPSNGGTSE